MSAADISAHQADDSSADETAATQRATPGPRSGLMWVTLAIAAGIVLVDQVSKWVAVAALDPFDPVEVVGTWLRLTLVRNPGAAFSLGIGYTFVFSLLALGVIVVIVHSSRKIGSLGWSIALGGILGGALGNLIDRIFRSPGIFRGHVVDFLQLPHWPVFNVADMAISGSAVLMVVLVVRGVQFNGSVTAPGNNRG